MTTRCDSYSRLRHYVQTLRLWIYLLLINLGNYNGSTHQILPEAHNIFVLCQGVASMPHWHQSYLYLYTLFVRCEFERRQPETVRAHSPGHVQPLFHFSGQKTLCKYFMSPQSSLVVSAFGFP